MKDLKAQFSVQGLETRAFAMQLQYCLLFKTPGTPSSPLSTVFTKTGGGSTTNVNISPTADSPQFPPSAMVDTFYELSAGGVLMDSCYHALLGLCIVFCGSANEGAVCT